MLAADAFAALPPDIRAGIVERARVIQAQIEQAAPELEAPYLLHGLSEQRIDQIVEKVQSAPCVFLGPSQECLIYASRPLACRLEGVPDSVR